MRVSTACILLTALFRSTTASCVEAPTEEPRHVWKNYYGPEGGYVHSVAIAPSDPRTVYAITGATLYRSDDGAEHWRKLRAWRSISGSCALAVHPQKGETLIVRHSDMEISRDGGKTWTELEIPKGNIWDFFYSDDAKPLVYLLAGKKIYKSADDGASWKEIREIDTRNHPEFFKDMNHPSFLFVRQVYANAPVEFSPDGGATWKTIPLPEGEYAVDFGAHPDDKKILFYLNERGVCHFTDDFGETWEIFYDPNNDAYNSEKLRSLVISALPKRCNPINNNSGVFRRRHYAVGPGRKPVVFHTPWEGGIVRTTDGGKTWSPCYSGIASTSIMRIYASKERPGTLFCAAAHGVYMIDKDDTNWRQFRVSHALSNPFGAINAIAIDPEKPSNIFMGHRFGLIFKSEDRGSSWSVAVNLTLNRGYNMVHGFFFPPDEKDSYFVIVNSGIFKCSRSGRQFERIAEFVPEQTYFAIVLFNPCDPSQIFVAHRDLGDKCRISSDMWKTWREVKMPFEARTRTRARWAMASDGSVFTISGEDMWTLPAGKDDWQKVALPRDVTYVRGVAASGVSKDKIYFWDDQQRIWATADAGKSWNTLGKPGPIITTIFEHPADGTLFVGTKTSGVMTYAPHRTIPDRTKNERE